MKKSQQRTRHHRQLAANPTLDPQRSEYAVMRPLLAIILIQNNKRPRLSQAAHLPSRFFETTAGVGAADFAGIDIGVKPFARPTLPSEFFSLQNEFR